MGSKKKNITIYDLAKELNVSPSTISRALKDHEGIGKETKKAVQKLAREKGYRLNSIASSLRTSRSNTFGVMVSWINRPFISSLIAGIENKARENGYQAIIAQSHDNVELEKENLQVLYDSRVSALFVSLAMETKDYSHFDLFTASGIPVIFVDRVPLKKNIHKVQINNFNSGFIATEHLIEQGCKRIAYFGGATHQAIYNDRRSGYVAALKKYGFEVDESLIFNAESLSAEEGTRLTKQVLKMKHMPDAIFCANDTAAVSAIMYAKKQGIRIPDDLAIIGFNNDPICEIVDPPLSSVSHPAVEMGESVVDKALAILDGDEKEEFSSIVLLETKVIMRASSNKKGLNPKLPESEKKLIKK